MCKINTGEEIKKTYQQPQHRLGLHVAYVVDCVSQCWENRRLSLHLESDLFQVITHNTVKLAITSF